jgi:ferredoxin-NADP reductase/nitrite reductase/ring-hydroxylating ferredoxin subunit
LNKDNDFVKVANTSDIQPKQMKEVQLDGEIICIINVNEKYYAINNVCTHEGGPLADGKVEGYEVECPWHGSKFDVRTGEVTNPPASEPEPTYEVKVEGNSILIKKQSGKNEQEQRQSIISRPTEFVLTISEKQKMEGTDVMSFKFSREDQGKQNSSKPSFDYRAGQFAFFDIGGVYNDPKGPIRHFTIASSPTENFILISTRIRDSPYKKRLASLEPGIKVKVKGPEGNFVLHEDYSKSAIFLSGGIGVTPFRSMIKYVTDKSLPLKIVMFDSNRDQKNILFKNEFDECASKNKNLRVIYTITEDGDQIPTSPSDNEWKGERGRIDKAMLTKHLADTELKNSIYYICGPPPMLKSIQSLLQELRIQKDQIKVEEFTGY